MAKSTLTKSSNRCRWAIWALAFGGCCCGLWLSASERFVSIHIIDANDNQLYLVADSNRLNLHGYTISILGTEMFQEEYETRSETAFWLNVWIYGLAACHGIAGASLAAGVGVGLCGILSFLQIRHRHGHT